MSEQCLALVDSVKLANKKISMNDLLDLCDEYDLSPNEVDWVTNSLSAYLSDFDENSFEGVSDDDSLDDCIDLTDISSVKILDIDSGIAELPEHSFENDSDLVEIRIPDKIKSIGEFCFSKCQNLETVVIPKSVCSIQDGAFTMCPKLKRMVFLGNLPESLPASPTVLVVYGNSKKSSYISLPNNALVILINEEIKKWAHEFDNFSVVRGFAYATYSSAAFSDKVIQGNREYIAKHHEELFYYSMVRNDRIILRYLIDNNQLPEKIRSCTLDRLLYDDYRKEIEEKVQIVSNHMELHPSDVESDWGYKIDSKRNTILLQFRGHSIDCVEVPSAIKDCPVTRIGANTFSPINPSRGVIPEEVTMRREIRKIVLPTSIKKIDENAFSDCKYVTIYIPHTVESIHPNAFGSRVTMSRIRLVVEKGSCAEHFAVDNKVYYYYDYPEYDQSVNFIIYRALEKKRRKKKTSDDDNGPFQNGLDVIITKEDSTPFSKSALQVSAEGYGVIGSVGLPQTINQLPARLLEEKFFCVDADYLSGIIDDKMNAKILEAYPEYAVCTLLKK